MRTKRLLTDEQHEELERYAVEYAKYVGLYRDVDITAVAEAYQRGYIKRVIEEKRNRTDNILNII